MKLMVAGCSFSAVSKTLPGTAWSERLAERLGWDLINLARQGCSNGGIRIQIDEIRRQQPDLAIIGPTFWDRMEIPADSAPYDWSQAPSAGENPPLERHLQDRNRGYGYRREDGIRNVNYGREPSNMICETIFTLAENYDHPYRSAQIDRNTQQAMKQYVNFLYDSEWKRQQDEWIMRDGIMQLFYSGIPFLLVANNLWNSNDVRSAIPSVVPDQYLTLEYEETPAYATNTWPFEGKIDPGYHGDPKSQEYLAEVYYKKICELLHL